VNADLDFALSLANDADALTLARFRAADLRVETKADLTPVTDADRAVERALRELVARERPGEAVLGEEEGDSAGALSPGDGGFSAGGYRRCLRGCIDPIDGTKNFTRGIPVWATLVALERDGEAVCGVVSAPALGRRWWAARGEGAYRDGEPIRVSGVRSLADATVSCSYADDLTALEPHVRHARGFGDFWQHVLVAEGALDLAVDAELSRWDSAAVEAVVVEAGGRFEAWRGRTASSNGLLDDESRAWCGR
jgi:histidinol-phosphatase